MKTKFYWVALLLPPYLERGSAVHLASGNRKSCVREIAIVGSEPIFEIMKTKTLPSGRMRSALTFNFSDRYTTPCASSIQNGLNPMVIVRRANLMNRALPSCLDSLRRNGIDRSPN